jgi:hypothetical protein
MAERRRVMRKCVLGSSDEVGEDAGGEGEEARRAATVREAAVPLCAALRCCARRVLRKLGAVSVGRRTLRRWTGVILGEIPVM